MSVDEQIFVPDIGFRPAEVLVARVPVVRSDTEHTVTLERAVSALDVAVPIHPVREEETIETDFSMPWPSHLC